VRARRAHGRRACPGIRQHGPHPAPGRQPPAPAMGRPVCGHHAAPGAAGGRARFLFPGAEAEGAQRMTAMLMPRFVTRRRTAWDSLTFALYFALAVRLHGKAEAVQRTARNLVDKVRLEHQPNMKRLARGVDIPADKAIPCAVEVINSVCRVEHISPEMPFRPNPEPPRCHLTPMKLAGYHNTRNGSARNCCPTNPWKQRKCH